MLLLTKDTTLSFKGLLLWLGHAGIVRQSIWFMDTRLKRPVSASLFKMTPSTEGQVTLRPAAKRCYLKGTPRDVRLWVLMIEMRYIFWMYLWWNLSTLYLLPCQMSYHRWFRSVGSADKNEVYIYFLDVPLAEFMYLVFYLHSTESYHRQFRSVLLCLCGVFWVLINSLCLLMETA